MGAVQSRHQLEDLLPKITAIHPTPQSHSVQSILLTLQRQPPRKHRLVLRKLRCSYSSDARTPIIRWRTQRPHAENPWKHFRRGNRWLCSLTHQLPISRTRLLLLNELASNRQERWLLGTRQLRLIRAGSNGGHSIQPHHVKIAGNALLWE